MLRAALARNGVGQLVCSLSQSRPSEAAGTRLLGSPPDICECHHQKVCAGLNSPCYIAFRVFHAPLLAHWPDTSLSGCLQAPFTVSASIIRDLASTQAFAYTAKVANVTGTPSPGDKSANHRQSPGQNLDLGNPVQGRALHRSRS